MNSYVATWQSTAVQQLLWSKVMTETGVIQIHETPSTAGTNSVLIILGHISPQHWQPLHGINTTQTRAEMTGPGEVSSAYL